MNKLYMAVLYLCIYISPIYGMELEVQPTPNGFYFFEAPQELQEKICLTFFEEIHRNVTTPEEARDYLISVSLVNKTCNAYANDPHIIKNVISNLSATLRQSIFIFYEEAIAEKLNTPTTQKYITLNNQLFSEHLNKADVKLLLDQGADPNYRRNIRKNNFHDPNAYDISRHHYSGCPLIFYVSDPTENGLKIAKYLLEHGASIDISTNNYTPLNIAINNNLLKMFSLLLQYKPTLYAYPGNNYLVDAIHTGNQEIINTLQVAYGNRCNHGLQAAVIRQDTHRIQQFFDHGASPDFELKHVVTRTLINKASPLHGETLPTTEILQLFCNNGIQDPQILAAVLEQARATKERAEEVIAILEKAGNSTSK